MSTTLLLALLFLFKPSPTPTEEPPPKPSVVVSFERQNVREDDSVRVKVLVSNESKLDLSDARLSITGPEFLEWRLDSCEGRQLPPNLPLGGAAQSVGLIAANSTLECRMSGKTSKDITVGEFNTLVTLRYNWNTGRSTAESLVTVEKSLKMNLLGSESVAGVPLALANYIVPGLIFWVVVGLFGVSWKTDALGDKMIYSVLVSLLFVGFGTLLDYFNVTSELSVSRGVSLPRLGWLAFAGLFTGAVVGGADSWMRYRRRKKLINPSDDEMTLLRKLLVLNPGVATPKSIVKLKQGHHEYVGSLSAHQGDRYYMVGWYKVDLNDLPTNMTADVAQELAGFKKGGSQLELFDLALRFKVLKVRDSIQTPLSGEEVGYTGAFDGPGKWVEDEISFYTFKAEGWATHPIEVEGEPPAAVKAGGK